MGHWVTLDDDQHVYIGSGGKVLATRGAISSGGGGKDRGNALAARSKAAIGRASSKTTRAIEHAKAAGANSEQAKTAQALRVQRYARKTGNDFDKAKAERAESLKELKPLRAEQQKVMATDSERFAKRPYETKHYTEKLHEVTKPYGYEDTKGTLPSYYPSKAKAALMLAKSNIRDQARATEATIARAKEAKLSLGKQVTGLDRAGGVSVQSRYEMAGKEAMQSRGFKKQEITLANEAQTKVKADVKGDYAVHRVPYEIPKSQERTGETHQITHVPTGKALPGTFTPSRAKTMVASLVARKVDAPAMLASKPGRIKMNRLYSAMANRYKG